MTILKCLAAHAAAKHRHIELRRVFHLLTACAASGDDRNNKPNG
jgi:hypothetical protein